MEPSLEADSLNCPPPQAMLLAGKGGGDPPPPPPPPPTPEGMPITLDPPIVAIIPEDIVVLEGF